MSLMSVRRHKGFSCLTNTNLGVVVTDYSNFDVYLCLQVTTGTYDFNGELCVHVCVCVDYLHQFNPLSLFSSVS